MGREGFRGSRTGQAKRQMPEPGMISPMIQALMPDLRMARRTASALSGATVAVMPMPMLKT